MHDTKWYLAILSGLISVIGYGYLVLEWKRGWLPARASWFIWIFVIGSVTVGMISAGAWQTAILPACYTLGTATIWVCSLKRGTGGWTRVDRISIALAFAGVFGWVLTKDPIVAVILNIAADGVGGSPTFEKLWKDPTSESRVGWTVFAIASALDTIAVREWSIAQALYPVFALVFCLVIVCMTFRRPTH